MKITIVNFVAFRSQLTHVFYNNASDQEIHDVLTDICETYEPLEVIECEEAEHRSLNCLTQFKTASHV